MNSCPKNKQRIAWMASGILDEGEAKMLRQHLESCPRCRSYWQSMSDLAARLVNANDLPQSGSTESLHARVVHRIRELDQCTPLFKWASAAQRLLPELRLAAISAAAVIAAVTVTLFWLNRDKQPPILQEQITTVRPTAAPPHSLASYRQAAETSFEALDALLAQQGFRNMSVPEAFTVSSLLAQSSEK